MHSLASQKTKLSVFGYFWLISRKIIDWIHQLKFHWLKINMYENQSWLWIKVTRENIVEFTVIYSWDSLVQIGKILVIQKYRLRIWFLIQEYYGFHHHEKMQWQFLLINQKIADINAKLWLLQESFSLDQCNIWNDFIILDWLIQSGIVHFCFFSYIFSVKLNKDSKNP